MRKTTVTLSDGLHAQWKATGLSIAEVVKRGLDGTGDAARHAASEARLARVEARLAQLEAAGTVFPARPAGGNGQDADFEAAFSDTPSIEDIEQRRELRDRLRAKDWHRTLLRNTKPDQAGQRIVTAKDTSGAFRLGAAPSRDRMHMLVSFGLATLLNDGETPYRWLLHDQNQEAGQENDR